MDLGFWKTIKEEKKGEPLFVLAPMADVTDIAFRTLITKYGKPDVLWTEFVSADGLCSPGRKALLADLKFNKEEHPIVAQLFTSHPEKMEEAAALCRELGFDGIDINMGCPDRTIEKQGAGAAMIKNPTLAKEIIRAAKRGAKNIPVSVKTRIGYNKNEINTWIPAILEEDVAVLTLHARTRKEMSLVPARWEHVKEVVAMRDAMGKDTLIFGNGDAKSISHARELAKESGADGVMLGRAIFGNPWLFSEHTPSHTEKLKTMVEHTYLFEKELGGIKNFSIMKKHYKAYVEGFLGAKELRMELMETKNADGVEKIVTDFISRALLT